MKLQTFLRVRTQRPLLWRSDGDRHTASSACTNYPFILFSWCVNKFPLREVRWRVYAAACEIISICPPIACNISKTLLSSPYKRSSNIC